MFGTSRNLALIWLAAGALALAACGDDDPKDPVTDTDTDTGVDTTDVGDDVIPDTGDDSGPVCESGVECTRLADCTGAGLQNAQCVEGCCVEDTTTLTACAGHLDPCESDTQTSDDFFCDTEAGLCLQRCDFDSADDTQSADCPLNSYCLSELTGLTDPNALNGVCIPGDCDSNIFDDAACGGTATCLPVGNGASFCVEAGTADVGDACNTDDSDTQPASDICAPGLLCFLNECVEPCNRRNGDDDCEEGVECLGVWDTTPRNQPGWCGTDCTEYSRDECGEDVCGPIFGRYGINEWICQPLGEDEVLEVGADCTADGTRCAEGLICVSTSDTEAECMQMCDPTGEQDAPTASCPGGAAGGDELIGETAFLEASTYLEEAAGDYGAEIRVAADGTFVAPVTIELEDGSVFSYVASTVDDALDLFVLEDLNPADELPDTGLRAVHASDSAGEVDIYLQTLVDAIGPGASWSGQFVADGFGWIAGEDGWAVDGIFYLEFVAGAQELLPVTVPTLATGEAAVRVRHAIAGGPNVDVYAGCGENSEDFADCDVDALVAADVAPGSFDDGGTFTTILSAIVSQANFIFVVAGADPGDFEEGEVLGVFTMPTVADDALLQLTAYDVGAGATIGLHEFTAPAEGEFSLTAVNASPDAASLIAEELIEEAVAYSEASAGATSAYIAVEPGDYGFTLQLDDDSVVRGDLFTAAEGDLVSWFVTDGADGVETLTEYDLFDTPAEGSGAARLVHLAAAAPPVVITLPGEADVVCTPSAVSGFGFCQEACTPFPRMPGEYGCEAEGDTCLPFVGRNDEPVEPQGYCSEDEGTEGAGGACTNDGFLGGDCADFAVCLDLDDTGAPICLPLCEPFAEGGCSEYDDFSTCSGVPPLVGQLNFSFCIDAQAGAIGDRCTEEGLPCAADSSICLDMGGGPTCLAVCREGFDDCSDFGLDCNTGGLNPDVVPTYMGLCQ